MPIQTKQHAVLTAACLQIEFLDLLRIIIIFIIIIGTVCYDYKVYHCLTLRLFIMTILL